MVFIDTLCEGSDKKLVDNFNDSHSEYEPKEQDREMLTEDERFL